MAKFTVKNASPKYIREIANKYLSEDWITFDYLARLYGKGKNTISNLLYRGVAEDILSDDIAEKVSSKVIHHYYKGNWNKMLRWEQADKERQEFITKRKLVQKENLKKKIELLEFQISTFDDNYFGEGPTKEELKKKHYILKKCFAAIT